MEVVRFGGLLTHPNQRREAAKVWKVVPENPDDVFHFGFED